MSMRVGYLRLTEMELALSDILGRKADLRTPTELSRYFRDEVMLEAEIQYVDLDRVWDTIIDNLPPLIHELKMILSMENGR